MKNIFISSFFLFGYCIAGLTYGQQTDNSKDMDQVLLTRDTVKSISDHQDIKVKKLNTSLEVGTSFLYSPKYYYAPSIFIAPNINYQLSSKFRLQGGLIIERSTIHTLYNSENQSDQILPITRAYLYAGGTYMLTPNLSLSGTAYKLINDIPNSSSYLYPYYTNSQGFRLDIGYKVSNSITFGVQIRKQNGYINGPLIH